MKKMVVYLRSTATVALSYAKNFISVIIVHHLDKTNRYALVLEMNDTVYLS